MSADSASLTPQLPVTDMEVAGVVRVGADLVEPQTEGSLATIEAAMFLGPAWADAMAASDYYRYQTGIGLWLDEGADVETLVAEAAPGQFHVVEGGLTADDTSGPKETVDYQARAALAAAALLALAGMVLVGQILGRQARRELADAATLRALGMTRRGLTSSAAAPLDRDGGRRRVWSRPRPRCSSGRSGRSASPAGRPVPDGGSTWLWSAWACSPSWASSSGSVCS